LIVNRLKQTDIQRKYSLNKTCVVIGSGLAGLSTAISLARRSIPVHLLFEKDNPFEATKACHGISTIKGILESDADLFALKLEGHRGFNDWLAGLEEILGIDRPDTVWVKGVLERFSTKAQFDKEFGRIYRRDFIGAKRVLLNTHGEEYFAEAFYPGDWWIDPSYLVDILWRVLIKLKVKSTEAHVTALKLSEDDIEVCTDGAGVIEAEHAIICAGAGSWEILKNAQLECQSLKGVPGYTFKSDATGESLCLVKGTSGVTRLLGGLHWGSTSDAAVFLSKDMKLSDLRWRTKDDESQLAKSYLQSIDSGLSDECLKNLEIRWGVRVRTQSRGPIVESLAQNAFGNIWINTGYYKSGIILSWLLAERFAESLIQREMAQ
jgi:glycine/D-amino acid oxidase-like deaminating enzyme